MTILLDDPADVTRPTYFEPDAGKGYVRQLLESAAQVETPPGAKSRFGSAFVEVAGGIGRGLRALGQDLANVPEDISSGRASRVARAAWDSQLYVETTVARRTAEEESYDRLIAAVKGASGVALQNPYRFGYEPEARALAREEWGDQFKRRSATTTDWLPEFGKRVFKSRLDELTASDPRVAEAASAAMIDFSPVMIAQRADAEMRDASAAAGSLTATIGASLAGGILPALRDPLNVAGLAVGAGPSAARTVGGRILDVAVREAVINGAITAAQQPAVQDWRNIAGLEAGLPEAAKNIAFGAGFGALFGAGAQGLRELLPKANAGGVSVKDIEAAIARAGVPLDAESRSALQAARVAEEADAAVLATRPKDLDAAQAEEALAQAIRHAEDPVNEPPAEIPPSLPRADAKRQAVTDETLPKTPGQVDTVDGKPVTFQAFKPAELATDAAAMQYKGGGDAAGVTDRLRSVTKWDPLAGGRVFVWERLDGSQIIADGHQRLGLAKRIAEADPAQNPELMGHLFREADGWTAADVRALAAKKNMQEGSGTALDAARILRDRPDLADGALPKGGAVVRDGLYLARLSDEAFALVNAGVIPEGVGARVGALAPDPRTHLAIMNDLVRFKPETLRETDLFIAESQRAGFVTEHQVDMFGALETTASLMMERVKVLDATIKLLKSEKRLFAGLERDAGRIEAAGNSLDRAANEARAADAAALGDIVAKLAQKMGPVSDALNEAARAFKQGGSAAQAARDFAATLDAIIQRDGLPALLQEPQLRPSQPVAEPGTPQALAAAERIEAPDTLTADMFGASKTSETFPATNGAAKVSEPPLKDLLAGKASIDELRAHPDVVAAEAAMQALPETTTMPGYGTPAFQAERQFTFGGETVTGYAAAVDRLYADGGRWAGGPVRQDRSAVIVLGPPAAGKSTLAERLAAERGARIIDPDEAKLALPEYQGGIGANAVHVESSAVNDLVLARALTAGDAIILPQVGGKAASVAERIDLLTQLGYKVDLVNLAVPPDEAFRRMIGRFLNTGRLIPPEYMLQIGDKPAATYAALKGGPNVKAFAEVDGTAPRGTIRVSDGGSAIRPDNGTDLRGGGSPVAREPAPAGERPGGQAAIGQTGDGAAKLAELQALRAEALAEPDAVIRRETVKIIDGAIERLQRDQAGANEASAPLSEAGADGKPQLFFDGVQPVTDRQRLESQAAKPMRGGDAAPPAGGLFDQNARAQTDLLDAIALPSRDDPAGTRLVGKAEALAEADAAGFHADLVKACKS